MTFIEAKRKPQIPAGAAAPHRHSPNTGVSGKVTHAHEGPIFSSSPAAATSPRLHHASYFQPALISKGEMETRSVAAGSLRAMSKTVAGSPRDKESSLHPGQTATRRFN